MNKPTSHLQGDKKRLITLICLLLFAGFMAVSLLNYYVSKSAIREALISRELPLTSDNVYSEIQKDLVRPVFISSMMAHDTFLRDWVLDNERGVDQISRYLQEIKDKYAAVSSFFVSEQSRNYYYGNGILKQVKKGEPRDAWYFRVRDMRAPYEINVDPDMANHDTMTIFINYQVYDYQGRFIGVTGVGLTVDSVKKLIENYRQRYQRDIYFVNSAGKITLHSPNRTTVETDIRKIAGVSALADTILKHTDGSFQFSDGHQEHLLNVRFIPELNWYIFVEKTGDQDLSELRRTLLLNLAIGLFITLLMLFLVNISINYYQRRLEEMATTDSLTGLLNRQTAELMLQTLLWESKRTNKPFCLLMADLDHFKEVNDTCGHQAGDQVLHETAQLFVKRLRASDTICRWGGEEFLAILRNCSLADARTIAENLRADLAGQSGNGQKPAPLVTVSIGLADYRQDDSLEALLFRADSALYEAKRTGRNRVCPVI